MVCAYIATNTVISMSINAYIISIKISYEPKLMRSSYVPYCRGRKFYGKPIIEGVQHPSETIYMPNYINHAVYNLDKTVGIGDNPFYSTAIEESAFQLFKKGSNPYSYIEDLQILPRYYPDLKGALQISKLSSF